MITIRLDVPDKTDLGALKKWLAQAPGRPLRLRWDLKTRELVADPKPMAERCTNVIHLPRRGRRRLSPTPPEVA